MLGGLFRNISYGGTRLSTDPVIRTEDLAHVWPRVNRDKEEMNLIHRANSSYYAGRESSWGNWLSVSGRPVA